MVIFANILLLNNRQYVDECGYTFILRGQSYNIFLLTAIIYYLLSKRKYECDIYT